MFNFSPENFFVAFWFVDQPSANFRAEHDVPNMNWIACIQRFPNGNYEANYRFAYYDGDEQREASNWYTLQADAGTNLDLLIESLNIIAQMTSMRNGGSPWERVDLNASGTEAMKILIEKPWMQIRASSMEPWPSEN